MAIYVSGFFQVRNSSRYWKTLHEENGNIISRYPCCFVIFMGVLIG